MGTLKSKVVVVYQNTTKRAEVLNPILTELSKSQLIELIVFPEEVNIAGGDVDRDLKRVCELLLLPNYTLFSDQLCKKRLDDLIKEGEMADLGIFYKKSYFGYSQFLFSKQKKSFLSSRSVDDFMQITYPLIQQSYPDDVFSVCLKINDVDSSRNFLTAGVLVNNLILIYRDNDLFGSIIDEFCSLAPHTVNIRRVVIPRGTDVNKQDTFDILQGCVKEAVSIGAKICADETCIRVLRKISSYEEVSCSRSLDYTLSLAYEAELKTNLAQGIQQLADILMSNRQKVCLVEDHISDHSYGVSKYKILEERKEKYKDLLFNQVFAKDSKLWISKDEISQYINDPDILLVIDRHVRTIDHIDKSTINNVLWLPFESAVQNTINKGLLRFPRLSLAHFKWRNTDRSHQLPWLTNK